MQQAAEQHHAMMEEDSGSESPGASTYRDDDEESWENKQSWYMGQCYKAFCCPCAVLGAAPHMVTIEQGFVGVVTKFGRFDHILPPGRHRYNVMAEAIRLVNLKVRYVDVRPQELMTADKLTIKIDAVCYYKVMDARKACFSVENYEFALGNLAQVTLRTVLGENTLAEIFGHRQRLNARLKQLIDAASDPWGLQVGLVELKGIELDPQMQRAMAAKAEANQLAEAKIIQSKAQRDAASVLAEAAGQMEQQPAALKLQWMETLRAMSTTGRNPLVIVPDSMSGAAALAAKSMAPVQYGMMQR